MQNATAAIAPENADRVRLVSVDPRGGSLSITQSGCHTPLLFDGPMGGTPSLNIIAEPSLPQPADLNCDGSVGVDDLLILLAAWGPCQAGNGSPCRADLNGHGIINVNDLLLLLGAWSDRELAP